MSSKSSNSPRPLPLGRVAGFRGRSGELTVRVASGAADRWKGLRRVLIGPPGERTEGEPVAFEVDGARAYRDRLVLKLRGVDDPGAAEVLRGRVVLVPGEQVPPLEEGTYYVARLVGLAVVDEVGRSVGTVADVAETGGTDLLVVEDPEGGEVLIPMADGTVLEVAEAEGRISVRLPDDLRNLNRREGGR